MSFSKLPVSCLRLSKCFLKRSIGYFNPTECRRYRPPVVVTVVGANTAVGEVTALILKQCPYIAELRLFDFSPGTCGTAIDLNYIDTNSQVHSFHGLDQLYNAVVNSSIVAVCGGDPTSVSEKDDKLFEKNSETVRIVALYTAEFSPDSVLCIASPPVTAMVPLASEEYKKAGSYNPKKIVGVSMLDAIRANSIIAEYTKENPHSVKCPIVGGCGPNTAVPVISQTRKFKTLQPNVQNLLYLKIQKVESDILKLKHSEHAGPCIISAGFAISRLVTRIVQGLMDMYEGTDPAYIRQTGHVAHFLPYLTSLVTFGSHGIKSMYMPHLSSKECELLHTAYPIIKQQIKWGESYITGAPLQRNVRCKAPLSCEIIEIKRVGDVPVDISLTDIECPN